MKIKSFIPLAVVFTIGMVSITGCQKGDLIDNPNLAASTGTVPASLILNNLTSNLIKTDEYPFNGSSRGDQYFLSNYAYYWSTNNYNYGSTEDSYNVLKYAIALQEQSTKQQGNQTNKYYAIGQFFKAYAGIWLSQRVGDIPFSQAGNPAITTPKYDTQHDVYKACLALLSSANSLLAPLAKATPGTRFDSGDIFGFTYLQWQKLVNTYTLRVLISLSKRVDDATAADLNIASTFNTIVNNPATYPIMTSNSDDLIYVYNTTNTYPVYADGNAPYDNFGNIGSSYVNATAPYADPRLLLVATPAPQQITGGKQPGDFTSYVGSDDDIVIGTLNSNAAAGQYSYMSDYRYFVLPAAITGANAEPFVFIGYPELCFNIAEAINRGWVTGQSSATWYNAGINASLSFYKISNGESINITNLSGNTIGTATANTTQFLSNVAYAGDNADGLAQIFTQRYVAMFMNSGWEPFYQWRRSVSTTYPNGLPTWSQGGAGIGTSNNGNLIPRRWEYPANEAAFNTANYDAALQSQFGGVDNPFADTWLTK